MASPRVSRLRPLLLLAAFLAVWWLLPVGVRRFTKEKFYTFEAPAWIGYSRLKDLQAFWELDSHSKAELLAAGRDLARANNELNLRLQETDGARDEAARLAEFLQLPREPGYRYEFARVIRRDENAWWQLIVIRKGREAGVAPGQAVVFSGGVVGRVTDEVSADTAVVELASSPSFRIAAYLGDFKQPVVYQGILTAPFQTPAGEVRDIVPTAVIPPGTSLKLVTSGLGGVFPQGLIIGTVDKLELGSDGLFQSGVVKLDERLSGLHEVAVLVPEAPPPPAPAPRSPPRR